MDKNVKRLTIIVSIAASMWACDGNRPSPTEPISPARTTYTLSGVVSLVTPAGQPSVGARVELSNGLSATTDMSGAYRLSGVPAGPISVRVSADACEPVSKKVTINGDTRLDFQVALRPFHVVSGVVSEMTPTGLAPVGGVGVSESYFHAGVVTDTNGFYKFEGPFGGLSDSFEFRKEGYQTVSRNVTINGNTQLDVQLVRR